MITIEELNCLSDEWGNPGIPCAMLDGSFGLLVLFGNADGAENVGIQIPAEAYHRWRHLKDFRLCGGPVGAIHKLPPAQELIRQVASLSSHQWLLEEKSGGEKND